VTAALAVSLLLIIASLAYGQVDGHVAVMADVFPDVDGAAGTQHVTELRARVFAERRGEVGDHLRLVIGAYIDGLVRRSPYETAQPVTDAILRPADVYVDFVFPRVDFRVGSSRIVWGRLDEFQPTDVVNPMDLARFLLEGRSEARLPVILLRGRAFLIGSSTLEGVLVPVFRAGILDQLDPGTSPFNVLVSDVREDFGAQIPIVRREPDFGWSSTQGGVRFTSTSGRVDWSVSAYRGFRAFPTITAVPQLQSFALEETFPRFTMTGGDFETVRGAWGFRGELAVFVRDELQSTRAIRGVPGRSLEGGIGVDRRAGDYRIAANALWSWRGVDVSDSRAAVFAADDELNDAAVAVVVAADRSFARETRTLRALTVYDPEDRTVFGRLIGAVNVRENTWLEGSAGVFAGSGSASGMSSLGTLGRLTRRDFFYARLKVFF
jgi:hypothetical protein